MELETRATIALAAMGIEEQSEHLAFCAKYIEAGELETAQGILSDLHEAMSRDVSILRAVADVDDVDETKVSPLVEEFMRTLQEGALRTLSESELAEVRASLYAFLSNGGKSPDFRGDGT